METDLVYSLMTSDPVLTLMAATLSHDWRHTFLQSTGTGSENAVGAEFGLHQQLVTLCHITLSVPRPIVRPLGPR